MHGAPSFLTDLPEEERSIEGSYDSRYESRQGRSQKERAFKCGKKTLVCRRNLPQTTPDGDITSVILKTFYCTFAAFLVPLLIDRSDLLVSVGSLWIILATVWVAWFVGQITVKLSSLVPSLLPQLIVGLLTRTFVLNKIRDTKAHNTANSTNLAMYQNSTDLSSSFGINDQEFHKAFDATSVFIRDLAMAVLVMRAGLGFDLDALKRVAGACIALTACPCSSEVITCSCLAGLVLNWSGLSIGHSMLWGALMGSVLGAATPSVIIPGMEDCNKRGLVRTDIQKSVVIMLVAAASFEDVVAITIFTLVISMAVSGGSMSGGAMAWSILKGPTWVIVGIIVGYLVARLLVGAMTRSATFRVFVAFTLPYLLNQSALELNASSAGPLSCILFGLTAARQRPEIFDDTAQALDTIWIVLEPAMFSMIGCELNITEFGIARIIRLVSLLLISLTVRTLVAFSVCHLSKSFTWRQSLFISISWIPKATVQAAIGSSALVRLLSLPELLQQGPAFAAKKTAAEDIVAIAVLSILVTAPMGAFLIRVLSNSLLGEEEASIRGEVSFKESDWIFSEDEAMVR